MASDTETAVVGRSVGESLERAAALLCEAGCETPRLDAEVLLAFALRCDRAQLVMQAREPLDASIGRQFDELVARRAAREPVAYITGVKEFRRLSLAVDRRVLIPRPETELLVEVALSFPIATRVADVGTGSGAVALALKDERPDLEVVGIDISSSALAVARANAARLDLKVEFVAGDLLAGGRYDAVLANLPYVSRDSELPPEVSVYEPALALFAEDEGLLQLRRLVSMLDGVSIVALEVGLDQAGPVAEWVKAAGFRSVERILDLGGHERAIAGGR